MSVLLLVLGFVLLVKGADWFVDGGAKLAGRFGIPQLVIGLTVVAMGTSIPEAAVSISAALKGNAGITVGNIVGSNILNILIILGIVGVMTPLKIQHSTLKYEIPFLLFITAVFFVTGMTNSVISRGEALLYLVLFLLYLLYLLKLSSGGSSQENADYETKGSVPGFLAKIVIGLALVVAGSDFVVDGASDIAKWLGMSERMIGLTVVAFGTSLPELVTSVAAARKKNADIAIGNIVGSNIFNILFVGGMSALICPVPFERKFLLDTVIAFGSAVILWAGSIRKQELRRPCAILMLISYAAYFAAGI